MDVTFILGFALGLWHYVAMDSLTFSHDSHSHRTDEHVESQFHLKIQVT